MNIFEEFFEDAKENRRKREKAASMRRKADNAARRGYEIIHETNRKFHNMEYELKIKVDEAIRFREECCAKINREVIPQIRDTSEKIEIMKLNEMNGTVINTGKRTQNLFKPDISISSLCINPEFPSPLELLSTLFDFGADDEYYEAQEAMYKAESYLEDAKTYREKYYTFSEKFNILKKYFAEEKVVVNEMLERVKNSIGKSENRNIEELEDSRRIAVKILSFICTKISDSQLNITEEYKRFFDGIEMDEKIEIRGEQQAYSEGIWSGIGNIFR